MQRIKSILSIGSLLAALLPSLTSAALTPMSEEALGQITGQALFLADKIAPSGTAGSTTDFTFYRAGLDVRLDLNLNLDEMKLGCGGANDAIDSTVCDIDLDYVRFMGLCTTAGCGQTSPDGQLIPGSGDPVTSDFSLLRPYFEFAIKNDNSRTQREVVGVKIGAQSVDGYLGVGQVLARGNNPNNHVGINAISGFLNVELSAEIPIKVGILGNSTGCIGDIACGTPGTKFYFDPARTTGTRQTRIQQDSMPLVLNGGLAGLLGSAYANLVEPLVFIHGFELRDTQDFFLSFQRQQVSYPTYDKTGYAVTANTGWWMNVPDVKVLNVRPPRVDIPCGLFGCLGALGKPGAYIENIELNGSPPQNCYGSTLFC